MAVKQNHGFEMLPTDTLLPKSHSWRAAYPLSPRAGTAAGADEPARASACANRSSERQ